MPGFQHTHMLSPDGEDTLMGTHTDTRGHKPRQRHWHARTRPVPLVSEGSHTEVQVEGGLQLVSLAFIPRPPSTGPALPREGPPTRGWASHCPGA